MEVHAAAFCFSITPSAYPQTPCPPLNVLDSTILLHPTNNGVKLTEHPARDSSNVISNHLRQILVRAD